MLPRPRGRQRKATVPIDAAASRAAIEGLLARGEPARAATLAEALLAAGGRDGLVLRLTAWARLEKGDFDAALALLDEALVQTPADALVLTARGATLRRAGRLSAALPALDHAIAVAPSHADAWLERAYAFEAGGALEAAAENYHRALKLDSRSAAAHAGFAATARLLGYPAATRRFAGLALALDAHDAVATCALAAVDIAEGNAPVAAAALDALLAHGGLSAQNRIAALRLLGDARDKAGNPAGAFAAYCEAGAAFDDAYARHFAQPHRLLVAATDAALAATTRSTWATPVAAADPLPVRVHAFLLGYPRSGTTLVENILATAPGVAAIEERPTLHAAAVAFPGDADGIARLAAADAAMLDPQRRAYWAKVSECGIDLPGDVFVDMDPLASVRLPLIARLFPQARVVLMRRDPRDVVLSCFRTNFAPNAAVLEFTSLERTARHYAATMQLIDHSLDTLPLTVHETRYEALVADFDRVSRDLCAFLDIPWIPALRDFADTAARRGVSTASVTQVRKGLYNGSGQWLRYAAQLAEVEPILRPWIARFGAD